MSYFVSDINKLQTSIMFFIKEWANKEKTPIPQSVIVRHMVARKVKSNTALNAVRTLLDKGYLRRAYSQQANRTLYVMIRNI